MLTMRWNNDEGHFYDFTIMYLAFLCVSMDFSLKKVPIPRQHVDFIRV